MPISLKGADRRKARVRKALKANNAGRPRLSVFRSDKNIYAQIIDDEAGKTIVSASTKEKGYGAGKANSEHAAKVGAVIAERAAAKNISAVVFDRAGFTFHGKVKALADAAREKGLQF